MRRLDFQYVPTCSEAPRSVPNNSRCHEVAEDPAQASVYSSVQAILEDRSAYRILVQIALLQG